MRTAQLALLAALSAVVAGATFTASSDECVRFSMPLLAAAIDGEEEPQNVPLSDFCD